MPNTIQETGTYFEIIASEYLNVSLQSSQEITVVLESVPKTISLILEASLGASSTELTVMGLESNTTYYKYGDSYKNEETILVNAKGSYTWIQNITKTHHIWL